jgi:nitroreductase
MEIKEKYNKLKLKYIELQKKYDSLKSDLTDMKKELEDKVNDEPKTFLNNLKWRRAEKHFAPGWVNIKPIENAIINAPSSYGMQPFHVFVIVDKELKNKLSPACYNQAQIKECHALFIFCVYTDLEARMDEFIDLTDGEKKRESITKYLDNLPTKVGWAAQQAYIALGYGLAAATELKIASCPMEGFMPNKVAKVLKLGDDLLPSVLLTVGRHVSLGPIEKKDRPDFFEKIKDYKLEPRFRFKDIIERKS